jgi:hypothetical protein
MPPQLSTFLTALTVMMQGLTSPLAPLSKPICASPERSGWVVATWFYQSSSSTVLPHLGFSFRGADSDDGRLKLTPGAAPQREAKDDGSMF